MRGVKVSPRSKGRRMLKMYKVVMMMGQWNKILRIKKCSYHNKIKMKELMPTRQWDSPLFSLMVFSECSSFSFWGFKGVWRDLLESLLVSLQKWGKSGGMSQSWGGTDVFLTFPKIIEWLVRMNVFLRPHGFLGMWLIQLILGTLNSSACQLYVAAQF